MLEGTKNEAELKSNEMDSMEDTSKQRPSNIQEKLRQYQEKRQEKALSKHEDKVKEWEQISKKLSEKFKRPTSNLIMERSCNDHRTKIEKLQFLESAISASQKYTNPSWELTLRRSMFLVLM